MTPTALVAAWAIGLFGAGALVIAAYSVRDQGKARGLWAVYASTIAIAAALLVPLAVHPLVFAAAAAACAWRCAYELATTYGARLSIWRHAVIALATVGSVAWGASQDALASQALLAATLLVAALGAPFYARAFRGAPAGSTLVWLLAAAFPLLAAAHLSHLATGPQGFAWVFVVYATVESQDSAAYLCGRLFGRRLLLPRLSPKKTVGGAVAGVIAGVTVGAAASVVMLRLDMASAIGVAAGAVVAGFAGDLFTSGLKRGAGVKDFPAVSKLHGGVLDIYDSTLFAGVVLSVVLTARALA